MKLSKNFTLSEFDCKDGSVTPEFAVENLTKLAMQLQVLRSTIDRPININSGYRSPEYNEKIGGAKHSQHKLGNAADITVPGLTPKQVHFFIERLIEEGEMQEGGLGLYDTFVHYDIGYDGKKRRWNG